MTCSANCLQPDGQNDNDWNQGLLFLNPAQVWLQPPGYVTRMVSRNYEPLLVASHVQCAGEALSVNAKRSADGKTLVLQVVNVSEQPVRAMLQLNGFSPSKAEAQVEELAGPLQATNTASAPERIKPSTRTWEHGLRNGKSSFTFAPCSFTVIRFE